MHGILLVWMSVAGASDGFEPVRIAHDCDIAMRPEDHPDGAAMRASCVWPEIEADRMVRRLSDYAAYDELIFPIDESRVVRTVGERALVYQRQSMIGISDREVLLWMWRHPEDGGTRFSWTTAADEPLDLERGSVRVPRNEGFWQVVSRPAGGVRVVHEIAMDAGGAIPRWLVNLVRTRSFARIMADVRTEVGGAG